MPRVGSVQVERSGGVVTITLDRPEKKNAMTASTAGNGAWMIDRKIELRMPLMTPSVT